MVWNANCLRFLRTCLWTYYEEPTMIFCSSTPEETEILPECAPAVAFIDECAYYDHEAKFQAGPILLLHHRATDKALGIVRHGDPRIVPGKETVDGHPCVQIKCGKYSYWTDLKNECLIRRYEWHRDEDPQPIFRVDLSYAENPQFGWVLTKWTVQYSFGNNNKGTSTSVVTAVEINGNPEPKEKLTVLPVGTVVNDERGRGRLRYLVLPDQQRREITREDTIWSATHAELLDSDPGKAIPRQFVELSQQMQPIGRASPADRDRSLAVLKSYLINRGLLQRDVDLTRLVAHRLFDSKEPDSAVRMCREFAQISDVLNRAVAPLTQELERELPFRRLLGSELSLTGKTLAGKPLDWSSYRGKVVLVDFWGEGCEGCVLQMPRVKELYEQYHQSGFDVIGIAHYEDEEQLRKYLADSEITWTTIRETADSQDSNHSRFNIYHVPRYFLIGRNGKVASVNAGIDQFEEFIKAELKKE
jgi:thiol-disulfide isomerase/thioredoxin